MSKKITETVRFVRKYFRFRRFRESVHQERARKYVFYRAKKESLLRRLTAIWRRKSQSELSRFMSVFSWVEHDKVRYGAAFFVVGAFLLSASAYIVMGSSYFVIAPSSVIIERQDTFTDINIAYKSIEDIFGKSLFAVSTSDITDMITRLQKNIRTVSVTRLPPNGVKIILDSYPPEFFTTVASAKQDYIVTRNGVLIREKSIPDNLLRIDIVDTAFFEEGFYDYRQAISLADMDRIVAVRKGFEERFQSLHITKLTYFHQENELHIALDNDTVILFGLDANVASRLSLLKYYNDSNTNILSQGSILYLDIRNPARFFACREKPACPSNLRRIYGDYYAGM